MDKVIYLDNAATTPMVPGVLEAIMPWLSTEVGYNASSLHAVGLEAYNAIEYAREQIALFIGADPSEVYFTSGATESINTVLRNYSNRKIITTEMEHPAVLNTVKALPAIPYCMPTLPNGSIDINVLEVVLTVFNSTLIVMQMANNETGVLLPYMVARDVICEYTKKNPTKDKPLLMLDATQFLPYHKINVHELDCDFLVASAHKFGSGLPGTGILYIKNGVNISPLMYGGHQENGFRPSTINTPGIVAAGYAAEYTMNNCVYKWNKLRAIRNYFEDKLINSGMDITINGYENIRLPGHSSVTFYGVNGFRLQQWLSEHGIMVSTGSACNLGQPSHVLKAIGLSDDDVESTIRFSFGDNITQNDIDTVVDVLQKGITILT